MKGLRFLDRRVGFSLGALSVLVGMLVPAVLPAFASAAQITARSISMSNATPSATSNYTMTFTPATTGATDYVVVWFCSDSPLAGQSCAAPAGMSLAGVSLTNKPASEAIYNTTYTGAGANYIVFGTSALTSGSAYSITLTGVTNPSTTATLYGRIETFQNSTDAKAAGGDAAHTGNANGSVIGNIQDNGSVAMATTSQIGVSAAVLESMTFCTYGDPNNATFSGSAGTVGTSDSSTYLSTLANGNNGPKGDCTNSNSNTATSPITLGQQQAAGILALDTTHVSYAAGWTGISTNASGGAIVYLKNNNASCAGLALNGGSTCQIPAMNPSGTATAMASGTAGYGFTFGGTATPTSFAAPSPGTQTGTMDINTHYKSNYALLSSAASTSSGQGNAAENSLVQDVSSASGGYVLGTEGAPATAQDVPFGIAAAISANTPAGKYTNNLSLIAVGTF